MHRLAGSTALTEIHGNTHLLHCLVCLHRVPFDELPEALPPRCDHCGGTMKTDGVMFGELISQDTLQSYIREADRADCMLLVGTTAVVSPAADFAWDVLSGVHPLIEVNLDPTIITTRCRVAIHGKAGEIVPRIVAAAKQGLDAAVRADG